MLPLRSKLLREDLPNKNSTKKQKMRNGNKQIAKRTGEMQQKTTKQNAKYPGGDGREREEHAKCLGVEGDGTKKNTKCPKELQ